MERHTKSRNGGEDRHGSGFGRFKFDLSEQLSRDAIDKLSLVLNFSPAERDRVRGDNIEFIASLEEKALIRPDDIGPLLEALRLVGLEGIARKVATSFSRNVLKTPSRLEPTLKADILQDKCKVLVEELKQVYVRLFSSVTTVPFLQDELRRVSDVYVESTIELEDLSQPKDTPRRWSTLRSRHDILMAPESDSFDKRFFIEGDPGYGKTILLLQYACDWHSKAGDSPLKNADIFVLLRLRYVCSMTSIYDAIKSQLPADTSLTRQDIEDIINSGRWSVVLAFDGYDEIPLTGGLVNDVIRVIQGRLLSQITCIITTRPTWPQELRSPTAKFCRLAGFNEDMQDEYIRKTVTENTSSGSPQHRIMNLIKRSPFLSAISQVPLFFSLIARRFSDSSADDNFDSVTGIFAYMMASFFCHDAKRSLAHGTTSRETPDNRSLLASLAFKGLSKDHRQLLWNEEEVRLQIGTDAYDMYISTGLLLREQKTTMIMSPGRHEESRLTTETLVRFFHKTFQEFYAAHFIKDLAKVADEATVHEALARIDAGDFQYVFQFACGLNPDAAVIVSKYLAQLGSDGRMFSILCLMETGSDTVNQTVSELCSKQITITRRSSRLLQMSTIKLLQVASEKRVAISSLTLMLIFKSVDLETGSILLHSGYAVPRLDTLKELIINYTDLRQDEAAEDVLELASQLPALRILRFGWCKLPAVFEDRDVLQRLQAKQCQVTKVRTRDAYNLNLRSGSWEKMSPDLASDLIQRMANPETDNQ